MKLTAQIGIISSRRNNYDSSAQSFFTRASNAGASLSSADKSYINDVVVALKSTLSRNGSTFLWDEIDVLNIQAMNKTVALMNLKTDSFGNGTIVNDYVGSWSDAGGFVGNSSNFRILTGYNPADGGTYKYTQNSACLFVLNLSTALTTGYSLGTTNSTSTTGTIITAGRTNRIPFMDLNIGTFGSSAVAAINLPSNRAWVGMGRTGAASQRRTVDGASITTDSHASSTMPNFEFVLFARNRAGTIQDFSNNATGVFCAGSKDIDEFKVQAIIEQYFLKPRNLASWMPNRLTAFGDSMTAPGVNGNYCRWSTTALASLGSTWQGHADGLAGGTIAANLEPKAVTNVDPYKKNYLTRDILVFLGGTNDLSNSSSVTGTTIYNYYVTWVANRTAAGYTSNILIGMLDRDATFSGGQTQAGFDTGRTLFNSLMIADFTVATAVTNVWKSNLAKWAGCCFINVAADSKYNNAADTTYFLADGIHPNATLDDDLANTYIVPIINANII